MRAGRVSSCADVRIDTPTRMIPPDPNTAIMQNGTEQAVRDMGVETRFREPDTFEAAEQMADRVVHVHLKGVDREVARLLGAREAFRPLGDGGMDVARLLELLEQARHRGWYVLEQDIVVENEPPKGTEPVADVRKSLEFLKQERPGGGVMRLPVLPAKE